MAEISMGNIGESFAPGTDDFNTNFVKLFYDTVANTFLLRNTVTGALVATIGQVQLPIVLAAAVQATFANETMVAYPIGKIVMITDYKTTGTGFTVVKNSLAGSNYTDWRILATDAKADTNGISATPKA